MLNGFISSSKRFLGGLWFRMAILACPFCQSKPWKMACAVNRVVPRGGVTKKNFAESRVICPGWLGAGFLIVGFCLLVSAVAGDWTRLGDYLSAPARNWERYEPDSAGVIQSYADLLDETRQQPPAVEASPRETMDRLYWLVVKRFTHREASHTFFSNWIAFGLGIINPGFSHIWDVDLMVGKGHSLLCDQSSYLLLRLAHDHGIKVRHVGLDGHVVMEAWYAGDWHLYDPDLEVVPVDPAGQVLSVDRLAKEKNLLEHYYGRHGMVEIVGSRENDNYVSYPEAARFTWQAEVLARLEKVTQVMKYLVPVLLLLIGLRLSFR